MLIHLLLTPVLVILLGLLLIFRPDSASAMVAKVIGSGLILIGIAFGAAAVISKAGLPRKVIASLVCVMIGGWLLKNPLRLAAAIGRIAGILVALRGVQDLQDCIRLHRSISYALLTAAVGVLLIVLPMTASRLVIAACGVVVVLLGIATLADRLRPRRLPGADDDIIDAL